MPGKVNPTQAEALDHGPCAHVHGPMSGRGVRKDRRGHFEADVYNPMIVL